MKNQKGFTLMEILFVVLLIALIVSFAMPAIRNVRFSVKNSQAKAALRKLAEAAHSYYEYSRGSRIDYGSFVGSNAKSFATETCENPAASGVPSSASTSPAEVAQLFACGFLDWKDFAGLPYTFYICDPDDHDEVCTRDNQAVFVSAIGENSSAAGAKFTADQDYLMYIMPDSIEVFDTAE